MAKTLWPEKIVIYTDGASRGNPGPCSLGVQVFDLKTNQRVYEEGCCLGENTNNFAEYSAAVRGLELAVQNKAQEAHLFSDSELVIRQLQGNYKVKSPKLKPLFQKCRRLLRQIPSCFLKSIPREQNTGADALANQALDEAGF